MLCYRRLCLQNGVTLSEVTNRSLQAALGNGDALNTLRATCYVLCAVAQCYTHHEPAC